MNKMLYQSIKVTTATILAIFIAEFLQLHYSATAGIIAMLSVLDTRKQTVIVGIKRLAAASSAVLMAILLFNLFGHRLWVLGLFLLIYIPLFTYLKTSEAITVGTVLVTHIYAIQTTEIWIFFNEIGLLGIGIAIGALLNFHMLNIEKEIRQLQLESEEAIKAVLRQMSLQLLNQCSLERQVNQLEKLELCISHGTTLAVRYNNNYILKDYSYFQHYFEMRRQQYYVLKHMQTHFKEMFIAIEEARILSDYSYKMAEELNENNDGMVLMTDWNNMRDHYRKMPLPKTRDEFENRAVLYQYMNDLAYFNRIKMTFMVKYGDIQYC